MPKFVFHPVAEMFPLIEGEEFDALVEDVRRHGQREPALVVKQPGGVLAIVDGRNRYRVAEKLGRKLAYHVWDGKGSLAELACSLNLRRRHLTPSQKAAAAVAIEEQFAAEAEQRRLANLKRGRSEPEKIPDRAEGDARDLAAKACGVNAHYISDAKLIRRLEPKTFELIVAGAITLPAAKRVVLRNQKTRSLVVKAQQCPAAVDWEVRTGDCLGHLPAIPRRSARMVFTDPPYNIGIDYGEGSKADQLPPAKYLGWCERWMEECVDVLTPDGSMWVLINDEWADHFGVMLSRLGLHRRAWVKWYETFGTNCADNFNRTSRHLFYYVKDARRYVFNREAVRRESDRQSKYADKRANPWGKIWDDVWEIPRLVDNAAERVPGFPTQIPLALVRPVVECATEPGDLAVDPFGGSGTTAEACARAGRRSILIEKNPITAEGSRTRLRAVSAEVAAAAEQAKARAS